MKIFRNVSLILVTIAYVSCSGTSEDPLIGDWDRRSVFPIGGRGYAASFVIDNTGYVVGGFDGTNPPRTEVVAFVHNLGSVLTHDQTRTMGQWNRDLGHHSEEMYPRQQAVGFSLTTNGNSYGYVGSGWIWKHIERDDREEYATANDFWRYDPADNTWQEIAPLPAPPRRGAFAFSLTVDGKEYGFVGGGTTDRQGFDFNGIPSFTIANRNEFLNDLWRYDPEGSTQVMRQVITIEQDANGDDFDVVTEEIVELPGQWTAIGDAHFGKRAGGVAFVIDNKAYICNGVNPTNINDFWVFNPNRETYIDGFLDDDGKPRVWRQLRTMNSVNPDESFDDDYRPLGRTGGVAYTVRVPERNNILTGHIVGGSQTNGSTNWEYDEDDDLWMQRTSFMNHQFAQHREGMVSFSFPSTGRAFIALGRSGPAQFWDEVWEFIPRVDDVVFRDLQ